MKTQKYSWKISTPFTLFLKHRNGTTERLKRKISKQLQNLNVKDQTLIFKGNQLQNDAIISTYFPYGETGFVNKNNDLAADAKNQFDSSALENNNNNSNNSKINSPDEEATVFVMIKPLIINVKAQQQSLIILDDGGIQHTSTVTFLKQKIAKKMRASVSSLENSTLIFEGKTLYDGNTLSSYGVYSGCIMHLFVK